MNLHATSQQDYDSLAAELVKRLRISRNFSRGQLAKRFKSTSTIIYNLETGRSRIKLSTFFDYLEICRYDVEAILSKHSFSVQKVSRHPAELMKRYRQRIRLSQKALAEALGYASSSMVHHFEKGIREPSLVDFFRLAELAGENLQGLILEVTGDEGFARHFPKGDEVGEAIWEDYWSEYYVSAIRQIMRTNAYARLKRLRLGYFAKVLGISHEQERHALAVLTSVGMIRWERGKPEIIPNQRIVVPKNIPKSTIDRLKAQWLALGHQAYLSGKEAMLSVDTLPVSRAMYQEIVQLVRALQDELHNKPFDAETDGVACLTWMTHYLPLESP